jgi:hypothetical protein
VKGGGINKLRIERFAGQTLVGSMGKFPRDNGNCFSIVANDGVEYFIVNCFAENCKEWMSKNCSKGGMQLCEPDADKYPEIEIIPYDSDRKFAKIIDERIPKSWLRKTYCECCVPSDLLPEEQRKKQKERYDLAVKEGRVSIICLKNPDGTEISQEVIHENIKVTPKKLKVGWTIKEEKEVNDIDTDIPIQFYTKNLGDKHE